MGKEKKGVIRVQNFDYCQSLSDWKIRGMTRDWAQIKIDTQSNPCHKSFTHEVRGQETLRPRPKVYSIVLENKTICFIIEMNEYQRRRWGQPTSTQSQMIYLFDWTPRQNLVAEKIMLHPPLKQLRQFHSLYLSFLLFGIAVAISSK